MKNTICVFGDSVARGVVLDKSSGRYSFLKTGVMDMVKEKTGSDIKNYSKFGCTIRKGKDLLEKHSDEIAVSDYSFIEYGGNDCDYHWKEISNYPEREHLPNTSVDEFCSIYRSLIKSVKKLGTVPVVLNLPPIDAERFFKWISKGNSADNILSWLGSVNRIFEWHTLYNDCVEEIALEENAALIDIRSVFLKKGNFSAYICEDGMHPNFEGHRLMCGEVLKIL